MTDNLIERKAFADFLLGNYGKTYSQKDVDHYIEYGHVSWLAWQGRAAIERQSVPSSQDAANLLSRYERQWHRMGELWERHQGKGWPDKESAEFQTLRDKSAPATRAALLVMLTAIEKDRERQGVPAGYVLVPIRPTQEILDVTDSEGWTWPELLAAAGSITEAEADDLAASPQPQPVQQLELTEYDAGLLNDFGGGNVEWWQDYIRAELGRAFEHYQSQVPAQGEKQ